MARGRDRLTDRQVRAAKPGQTLNDGGGLMLAVSREIDEKGKPLGARWFYRYWANRVERRMGLGTLSEVSLAKAREKRDEQAAVRESGIDPIQARRDEKRLAAVKAAEEKTQGEVPKARQLGHVVDEYHRTVIVESGEYKSASTLRNGAHRCRK